jgi:hypothetical protein
VSLYLDTTGLVACFLDHGRASAAILKAWRQEEVLVVSAHADLEFTWAMHRLLQAEADPKGIGKAVQAYQKARPGFVCCPTDRHSLRAALLGLQHGIPPEVSLHLAVAVAFRDQILAQAPTAKDPVLIASMDPEMVRAAKAMAFRVVP